MTGSYQITVLEHPDGENEAKLQESVWTLLNEARNSEKLEDVSIERVLKTYLGKFKQRYCLLTFHSGFKRDTTNKAAGAGKSPDMALLASGMDAPAVIPQMSDMYVAVIDKETDHPVYFDFLSWESNPMDEKVVHQQTVSLINKLMGK